MNRRQHIVILTCVIVMAFCSCETDEQLPMVEQYVYTMSLDASLNDYDASSTRANYDWPDETRLYLHFVNGNQVISGYAYYDKGKNIWNIVLSEDLVNVDSARCEAYYFRDLEEGWLDGQEIPLSDSKSIVYQDTCGYYTKTDEGVSVVLTLLPKTGRIRFKGEPGRRFTICGLHRLSSYDSYYNRFDSTAVELLSIVEADGYTPYYYAFFPNSSRTITIIENGLTEYSKDCSPAVLQSGKSGYMSLPTEEEHTGWNAIKKDTVVAEAIDLGLSVLWASHNVGATAPEEFGGYYAWGETRTKYDYSDSTYLYYSDGEYLDIGSNISGTDYDVAHVKWGDGWRMPTKTELEELFDQCTNDGNTFVGYNGNRIYIPFTGVFWGNTWSPESGLSSIWTSTLHEESKDWAYYLNYHGYRVTIGAREDGRTIRPVKDKVPGIDDPYVAEAVDLGLSVKWASWNVGATAPEESGGYYAWGETKPKDYYPADYDPPTSWNNISSTQYDVAHVKWGNGWRMPTGSEMHELCNNCSWQRDSINGINGILITGVTGNSIFLPASGYYYDKELRKEGARGYYWAGEETFNIGQNSNLPNCLQLDLEEDVFQCITTWHHFGFPIRPVKE